MSQRVQVTTQAIQALPQWLAFLRQKRAEVDQRLAQLQNPAAEPSAVDAPAKAQDWLTETLPPQEKDPTMQDPASQEKNPTMQDTAASTTPAPDEKRDETTRRAQELALHHRLDEALSAAETAEKAEEATRRERELALHRWLDEALSAAEAADAEEIPTLAVLELALARIHLAVAEEAPVGVAEETSVAVAEELPLSEHELITPASVATEAPQADIEAAPIGAPESITLPNGRRMRYLPASEALFLRAEQIAPERLAELRHAAPAPVQAEPVRTDADGLNELLPPPTPPEETPRSPWLDWLEGRDT